MNENEKQIREYKRQIERFKSTKKGMFIGGIIVLVIGIVLMIVGIIFYASGIVRVVETATTTSESGMESEVVKDVFSIIGAALGFSFGIILIVGGIVLLVVQKVAVGKLISNRERKIDELSDYDDNYQSDK